ncbi:ModD protein [Azonexus hydrophilus]|uniref:Putative pyrophosphorylase ModD n=1 Tax=Azonexus hydrophilus TaxID=418702 RepID=A0A1R1I7P5_9RHOO|nr:ModD protein [Azonexus hydrophilus]OMG54609.1 ModD protein [Azonexus hydrophilus]
MSPYTLPDHELERLLGEDAPAGDATTFALDIGECCGRLDFRARFAMVVCGSEEARRLGELRGLVPTGPFAASGTKLQPGETILSLTGEAAALHIVWKTAQTLMEYLSGIATTTADIVAAAHAGNPDCAVVCTRKNFPGTKAATVKAVLTGGASPHRLSLSETLLVFAEHRAFLAETPAATLARLRRRWPERAIVVEVGDEAEALAWAGANILQLEKWPIAAVDRIKQQIPGTRIAAAGGVNAANAADYARAGAAILVTSAPYFAGPRDVAVSISPA